MKSLFTFSFALLISCLIFSCGNSKDKKETKKLNILWFVCEDQSPDYFPFYGDATVSLPNLERLANEGVTYENMYAPVPVCSPTRSGIITGMYPSTIGTHNMRTFNPYKPENEPTINVPSYSPVFPEGVEPFPIAVRNQGYYCTNNFKEDYNFNNTWDIWDESSKTAHFKNRKEGQPFFAVFNYNITHESAIWGMGDSLTVDPSAVKRLPYFPADPTIDHDLAVNYSNLKRMDDKVGKVLADLEKSGELDNTIIFFYSDHGGPFARQKRSIYESGTKVPFIVRYPDQSHKGTRNTNLHNFIDFAPTVMSLIGLEPSEHFQGQAFLGVYAEKKKRDYLFTTSDRFDECIDRKRAVRNDRFKYIRNYHPDVPYALPVAYRMNMPLMQRLVEMDKNGELVGPQKLWFAKTKPEEELYDLEADPYEFNNLAKDPKYGEHLRELKDALAEWEEETNDLGRIDERELIKRWSEMRTKTK